MKKIIEYKAICSAYCYEEALVFNDVISELLKNNWQPLGGLSVDACQNLYQAMVKYEQDKKCPGCGCIYVLSPCCATINCHDHGKTADCECNKLGREFKSLMSYPWK